MATKTKEAEKVPTKAELLWDRIKDCPIEMFALPNQTVKDHCTPYSVDPEALYVTLKSSAVLTALENTLRTIPLKQSETFDISQTPTYTIIRVVPKVV